MRSDGWPSVIRRILWWRRRVRFAFMMSHVETRDGMRVVDLGCGRSGRSTTDFVPTSWDVVGVDRLPPDVVRHRHPAFRYERGDVSDLSTFRDGEFDLAISVGLLEHVTDDGAFEAAAREIQRVARQYALVVPYRYCWIEPHYSVPMFPVLPRAVQNGLVRMFDLHGHRTAARRNPRFVESRTRWRTNGAYRAAFPGSRTLLTPTLETVLIVKSARDPGPRADA